MLLALLCHGSVFASIVYATPSCSCSSPLDVLPRNPEPFLVSLFTLHVPCVCLCAQARTSSWLPVLHRLLSWVRPSAPARVQFLALLAPALCWGCVKVRVIQGALGLVLFKTLRPVATQIPTSALSLTVVIEVGRCSSGRACCGAALRKASMQPEKGPFKE